MLTCVSLKKSGISDLIPDTVIDDVLFDPCGYSMNGLLPDVSILACYDWKPNQSNTDQVPSSATSERTNQTPVICNHRGSRSGSTPFSVIFPCIPVCSNFLVEQMEICEFYDLQGQYFTIHITPEPECSYVSFESNVPQVHTFCFPDQSRTQISFGVSSDLTE